jgi:hypothetical protein
LKIAFDPLDVPRDQSIVGICMALKLFSGCIGEFVFERQNLHC